MINMISMITLKKGSLAKRLVGAAEDDLFLEGLGEQVTQWEIVVLQESQTDLLR